MSFGRYYNISKQSFRGGVLKAKAAFVVISFDSEIYAFTAPYSCKLKSLYQFCSCKVSVKHF